MDTVATLITWFAVKTSNKPADEEHHYGHGKFESVAALIETVILFLLALAVLFQAIRRLLAGGGEIEAGALVFIVLGISIVVDINRIRALNKVAKETGSHALAADALHFASDLAGSGMVVVGLLANWMGFKYGDPLAAVGVAAFIGIAGYRLGKRTLDTLLDAAPTGRAERIREIAETIPGVIAVSGLRLRPGGNEVFGEITLDIARTLPLENVSAIKEQVALAVSGEFPDTQLTVGTQPRALATETVQDRIMLLAMKRRIPVHHVIVQNLGDRMSVSLDLEVDGRMTISEAHRIASLFEATIRDEFGEKTEVETHIEPLVVSAISGSDAETEVREWVVARLIQLAANSGGVIGDIHDVRVRKNQHGLVVNYHCRVAAELDVALVHARVDEIEHELQLARPDIIRVIGHAELEK